MSTRITERPIRLDDPDALRRWSLRCHAAGMTVGIVPTMGALHAGHLSLVERALAECDRVVVSIFVNPAQFGPGEDFERYPRTPDSDLELLRGLGVHAVFLPTVAAMYPETPPVRLQVAGDLGTTLEGAHRPGHFDGVALVVAKLLISSRAERAYFGNKDAQQSVVVTRLARALDTGVQVVVCPVVRDRDGLALSSRNAYLEADERRRALAIPGGLADAARLFDAGERSAAALVGAVRASLDRVAAEIDYITVVDAVSLQPVEKAGAGCEILVAARIGRTRLIDALRLGLDDAPVVPG
ncbi:MAG: pantoate--beta-alanine ligase [Candidatus Dormibacteraeota bacterium]|nr:pantoate--beta-alanine ligase [Candidatus Dormibacteraeota bacterium]MBV8444311.1 pantoate--beta-alanine ligase [Candidatus Dormibacteraeota bacterium]